MKPLILPAAKVKAILDGATMFRVPVKPQPEKGFDFDAIAERLPDRKSFALFVNENNGRTKAFSLPFAPGTIVYLREAWKPLFGLVGEWPRKQQIGWLYKADGDNGQTMWQSPVTMSREAARIFLKITDVKVERLHEISEGDAIAEGVEKYIANDTIYWKAYDEEDAEAYSNPIHSFRTLYGRKLWEPNPWVFAHTFDRTDKPE